MKKIYYILTVLFLCTAFVLSNPNCPTGYTMAPTSTGTSRNCTNCHGDYSLNTAGGGITLTGLPATFTAGVAYPFSIKIAHSAADRQVWGYAIKAVDTTTNTVVGTWTSTNTNSSIKGAAGSINYELSHANAAVTAVANTYTYTGLTWNAPATAPNKVKFFVSAVAGNNNGNEAQDYVYTTTFSSTKYVAPPPPPPVNTLPTSVTITSVIATGTCDTLRTFSVPVENGVNYAWSVSGLGNFIISGQGTNSITASTKSAGSAFVTLSNTVGSIPTVSTAFTRALPSAPVGITGSFSPCPNSSFTYTTSAPAPTATQVAVNNFRWTVPANSVITSANTDSSSITISFGATFNGGAITVKSQSACNIFSAAKTLTVSPVKVIDVISSTGFWNGCIGNSVTYSVVSGLPITTAPSSIGFRWTIPAFTSITSANGDSSTITLQFNTGYKGGKLTAASVTSCNALATPVTKSLTHIGCAAGQRVGIEVLENDLISIYPVPNNGNFTLNIESSDKTTSLVKVSIMDVQGRIVYTGTTKSLNGIVNKNYSLNLQRGFYLLRYTVGDKMNNIKFIVQ